MPTAVSEVRLFHEGAEDVKSLPPANGETQLVRKAQNGDVHAFNDLVRAYQKRAYYLAYRILGEPESAGDATQEAFISAYRHLGALRGRSLGPWLMRIVTNACYDQMRKEQQQRADSLDAMQGDPEKMDPRLAQSDQVSPQQHVEWRELDDLIQQGLATLPFDQRTTLILADIEKYSYEQVAEITQANIGTVKSRLSRGRGSLRVFLLSKEGLLPIKYRRDRGSTSMATSGSANGLGTDRITIHPNRSFRSCRRRTPDC
jgi:RNA polymerase sigma-70 factor, ECF subfamily